MLKFDAVGGSGRQPELHGAIMTSSGLLSMTPAMVSTVGLQQTSWRIKADRSEPRR
jgi:hypothetical protein